MKALYLTALCTLALAVGPAKAQLKPEAPIGSRILRDPEPVERERAGRMMKGFARCIYDQHPAVVQRLIVYSDPVAIDFVRVKTTPNKVADDLGMSRCLGLQAGLDQGALGLRFKPVQLRALMLEEDYLTKIGGAPTNSDPTLAPPRVYVANATTLPRAKVLAEFSDCIAAKDAEGSDAMLRTVPRSDKEREMAKRLVPVLSQCLDQGVQIELTPAAIRIYAADGLWTRFVRGRAATADARSAR